MELYLAIAALVILVVGFRLRGVGRRPKDLPPGPPTLPLIGNLHLMPKEHGHLQFQKWAEEYGPVYSLILGTRTIIVLSSDKAVKDLLDKRSAIYSSRPPMFVSQNLISGGMRMVLMEYSQTWRMIRRMFHSLLNTNASKTYAPYQDLETKHMLTAFLDKPKDFLHHIRRYTNSLSTQLVFGFRVVDVENPRLKKFFHGIEEWARVSSMQTAALLDIFPILQSFPSFMLPIRKYAEQLHVKEKELYLSFWMEAKEKLRKGTAKPCFCSGLAKAQEVEGFSDPQAAYISGGAVYEAASDTTANTLMGFLQAMVLYPEAQTLVQEEIDRVCGDKMPDLPDKPNMPWVHATVKESLRWLPTAILGIPHCVIVDDEYMGYRIPKGATIMMNVWTIHMDPKRHSNPNVFDPTRYFGDNQTLFESAQNPDVSKRDQFVFGAGRRICQGMHIAEQALFLSISRLLWAFRFEKGVDEQGNEITPDRTAITSGLLVIPHSFPMKVTLRSDVRGAAIRHAWKECEALLDEEQQWQTIPETMKFTKYDPQAEE